MKKSHFPVFLTFALLLTFSLAVRAQDETTAPEPPANAESPRLPAQERPNILRELGLSREQLQTIRRLNIERKSEREQIQRRVQETRRNLDAAIYADNVNDAEVQTRLKEFQTAQADAAALRLTTEYEIRKILTPEQVIRFREIRQKYAEARENFQTRPKNQQMNLRRNLRNKFLNRQNQKPVQN